MRGVTVVAGLLVAVALAAVGWRALEDRESTASRSAVPQRVPAPSAAGRVVTGSRAERFPAEVAAGAPAVPVQPRSTSGAVEGAAAAPLRVLIVTEPGAPIPGAHLDVFRRPSGNPILSAAADERGEVLVPGPRPGDELRARAARHAGTALVLGDPPFPDPFLVPLALGAELVRGNVTDDRRQPVAGAAISVEAGFRAYHALSDERGDFTLWGAVDARLPSEVVVRIVAEGYCSPLDDLPLSVREFTIDGELRLVVLRCASLAVEVRDAVGAPVRGAELSLLLELEGELLEAPGLFGPLIEIRGPAGQRDDETAFVRRWPQVVPDVPLVLVVDHPDLGRREFALGALAPGEQRHRTVELAGRVRDPLVRFRVFAPGGGDLAAARVAVRVGDERSSSTSYDDLAADGLFEVERPAGPFDVQVRLDGYAPLRRSFDRGFHSERVVELVLEPSGAFIDVLVVDERGAPEAGILVSLIEGGTVAAGGGSDTRRTDADGRARFRSVDAATSYGVGLGVNFGAPGRFLFGREDDERVPSPAAHRPVRPGDPVARFVLVPPASLAGRIDTRLPDGSRVQLSCIEPAGTTLPPVFGAGCPIGEDGGFRFHGLPPGRYHLWSPAYGAGTWTAPMARIDVGIGERLRDLVIRPK